MRLRSVRTSWEKYGRDDPLWAVLSDAEKRDNRWDIDDFLATGRADVDRLLERLSALGASPPKGAALDFGCGAGRLTNALAARFDDVHGVDISAPMIEKARELGPLETRPTFHLNIDPDLAIFADGTFAFVLSMLVLQHNPPRAIARYIREFGRVVTPGGVVAIQIPDAKNRRVRSLRDNLLPPRVRAAFLRIRELVTGKPGMQMNPVPRRRARRMFGDAGFEVLAEDQVFAGGWSQVTYFAQRVG